MKKTLKNVLLKAVGCFFCVYFSALYGDSSRYAALHLFCARKKFLGSYFICTGISFYNVVGNQTNKAEQLQDTGLQNTFAD